MVRSRKFLRVKDVAEALEICESGAYHIVREQIKHRRFGRAIRIDAEDFKRFLERTVIGK